MRVYKTVRVDVETKFLLNKLIKIKEKELREIKHDLNEKFEKLLEENLVKSEGFSANVDFQVSCGSILEMCLEYFNQFEETTKAYDVENVLNQKTNVDNERVGTLTPRFYIFKETETKIEELKEILFLQQMPRTNQVIKFLIKYYYIKNILGNYSE